MRLESDLHMLAFFFKKKYYNALNASFAIKKNNVNYIWAQRVNGIRQYQR